MLKLVLIVLGSLQQMLAKSAKLHNAKGLFNALWEDVDGDRKVGVTDRQIIKHTDLYSDLLNDYSSGPSYKHLILLRAYMFKHLQYNLNGSNPDGSFTVDDSNSFFSPYKTLPIAQGIFFLILSWNCMLCVLIRTVSPRRF